MDSQHLSIMLPVLFIVFLVLILKNYITHNWGLGLFFIITLDFLSRIEISTGSLVLISVVFEAILFLSQPYSKMYVNRVINCGKPNLDLNSEIYTKHKLFIVIKRSSKQNKKYHLEKIRNETSIAPEFKNFTVFPARLESVDPQEVDTEAKRLATFSTVPRNSIPSRCPYFTEFANTGLYYDRKEPCVRCSRCTSRFELHSVPGGRRDWHVRWCPFHATATSTNNTIHRTLNGGHQLTTGGRVVAVDRPEENDRDVAETVDQREAYKTFAARFDSLREQPWAREPHMAETLARFGMFYGGVGDKLCCCSCNFIITDWSEGRILVDIRELHTEFDPRCPELRPRG
ncbi:unnamed protein product [Lymnaea stagnalis]|uniref:Uncharacterized protein n=1 Tax=Lymnaea stagnalis TaxID=6523 RepID=A0AAV2IFT4_LYMST